MLTHAGTHIPHAHCVTDHTHIQHPPQPCACSADITIIAKREQPGDQLARQNNARHRHQLQTLFLSHTQRRHAISAGTQYAVQHTQQPCISPKMLRVHLISGTFPTREGGRSLTCSALTQLQHRPGHICSIAEVTLLIQWRPSRATQTQTRHLRMRHDGRKVFWELLKPMNIRRAQSLHYFLR